METTNSNKLALAVLGTLLATMALGVFTSAVFSPHKAVKAGYELPAVQEAAAAAPAAAAPDDPLPELLAKADPAKGANDTKPCQACHSFDKGGPAKVGPPLYGVVGRPVASVAGFAYSDVLKAAGGDIVQFYFKEPTAAAEFRPNDGGGYEYRYVVMPMRT